MAEGSSEDQRARRSPGDEAEEEAIFEAEAETDDEPGTSSQAGQDPEPDNALSAMTSAAGAASPSGYRRPAPRPYKRSGGGLKATAAPLLMTVGLLMLFPAVWSVLHLSGTVTSEKDDADMMAKIMLACWPIAIALIGGGVWFMLQTLAEKKSRR